jgi:uncharacterized protein DUF3106
MSWQIRKHEERQQGSQNDRGRMQRGNSSLGWTATVVLLLASVMASVPPCVAQRNNFRMAPLRIQNRPHPQGHAGDWLRRYQGLSPSEREWALKNDPGFQRLSPERQQLLRQRLEHFSSLPPEQQQRMLNRMETWEHLTPGQKQQARALFGRMQQLPPDRRRMVVTAIRDLRGMPAAEREQVIDSKRFKGVFSPEERDIMRGATRLPLAPQENGRPEEQP